MSIRFSGGPRRTPGGINGTTGAFSCPPPPPRTRVPAAPPPEVIQNPVGLGTALEQRMQDAEGSPV